MDQIKLGKFINELRIEANLTQDELAEKLGVSSGKIISKWENGYSMPDFITLNKISNTLNVTLYELSICKRLKKKRLVERTKDFIKNSKDIFKLNIISKILICLSILLGVFFGICTIYTIDNYDTVRIYELKSLDDDFVINGNIILAKDYNVFNLLNIDYIGKNNLLHDSYVKNISYYVLGEDNNRFIEYSYKNTSNKIKLLEEIKRTNLKFKIDAYLNNKELIKNNLTFTFNILYKDGSDKIENIYFPFKIIEKYRNNSL